MQTEITPHCKKKRREKEIGTLLGVGKSFIPVHTFNGEDYVALFAFKEAIKGLEKDLIELEEENKNLRDYTDNLDSENDNQAIEIEELKKENRKLKKECEENDYLVEDNARWMKRCGEKTMEIKKLKSDLAYERTMLDNVRAEYKSLQNVNKKLRLENVRLKDRIITDENFEEKLDKENKELREENKKLSKRIDTMQEFIDYSEGVVNNAIQMLYEEGGQEKALDYLENCYAVGDDRQYEEMEKLDDYDLEI